jgi:hypothetical protein
MIERMGANLTTVAKTQGIAYAFQSIIGSAPIVTYSDTQGVISFTPEQGAKLREYITAKMADNTQSDLKLNLLPVVLPILLEKAVPLVGGILLLGFLIGRKKRRKTR